MGHEENSPCNQDRSKPLSIDEILAEALINRAHTKAVKEDHWDEEAYINSGDLDFGDSSIYFLCSRDVPLHQNPLNS
jgi:hypothetical protein